MEQILKEFEGDQFSKNSQPMYVWDITVKESEGKSKDDIIRILWLLGKKWAFQKEKGKEGYIHWQIRVSLIVKQRKFAVIKTFHEYWPSCHVSLTSDKNKGNMFYVTKEESRLEGPWTDKSELKSKVVPIIKEELPIDVQMIKNLWPWQENLLKISEENKMDFRTVNWVWDEVGKKGKSLFAKWLFCNRKGHEIMLGGGFRDMMRYAYQVESNWHVPIWIADMPREFINLMGKKEKAGYISALEMLKKGYCYDDRYFLKEIAFDPPQIWLFGNWKPDKGSLSHDRWRLWKLIGSMDDPQNIKLIPVTWEDFEEPEDTPQKVKIILNKVTESNVQDIRPVWNGKIRRRMA